VAAVLDNGLEAVEAAVRKALLAGVASDEVILNMLPAGVNRRTIDYYHARRPAPTTAAPL
jgi:hypothetical protein